MAVQNCTPEILDLAPGALISNLWEGEGALIWVGALIQEFVVCYGDGNTLGLFPCKFLKIKNLNEWNPPEIITCVAPQNLQLYSGNYTEIQLQLTCNISISISC